MNNNQMDERQKYLMYKFGFQSFYILLFSSMCLALIYDFVFSPSALFGILFIPALLSVLYYIIRCTLSNIVSKSSCIYNIIFPSLLLIQQIIFNYQRSGFTLFLISFSLFLICSIVFSVIGLLKTLKFEKSNE